MGKNNRARRAAKKRQRDRGRGEQPSSPHGGSQSRASSGARCSCGRDHGRDHNLFGDEQALHNLFGDEQALHELIVDTTSLAFWSLITGPPAPPRSLELADEVARYYAELGSPEVAEIQHRIREWLAGELPEVWERCWTPNDLIHACTRLLDGGHADLLARIIVERAEASLSRSQMPLRWQRELDALAEELGFHPSPGLAERDWLGLCGVSSGIGGADLWSRSLGIMRLLVRLPEITETCPRPSAWVAAGLGASSDRSGVDSKLLDKVRALLAKAESTNFSEEADALTAKAQELIARHAIDKAMIDRQDGGQRALPVPRRYWLDNPYSEAKSVLLSCVASANRCESIYSPDLGFSTAFGFADDLDVVDLLFTSLLVQGSSAVQAAGSVRDRSGRSRTRSFRSSFWQSYALRIGERLEQATGEVLEDAMSVHGRSLLPVLARREQEVREAMASVFPDAVSRQLRFSNTAGFDAGRLAADQADLAIGERLRATG